MKSPLFHFIIWLSVCIASLFGYGLWYTAVSDKSVTVVDLQNQIDVKTETASRIAFARTALAEISGDEAIVQNYFVPETEVVSFINDLEARARAQTAAIKVLSVSTGGTKKQPNLALSLTIDGTFDAVMRTVGTIEYAPYYLSIAKLSLGKTEKSTWHADLQLIIGSVPVGTATSTQTTMPKTISSLRTTP